MPHVNLKFLISILLIVQIIGFTALWNRQTITDDQLSATMTGPEEVLNTLDTVLSEIRNLKQWSVSNADKSYLEMTNDPTIDGETLGETLRSILRQELHTYLAQLPVQSLQTQGEPDSMASSIQMQNEPQEFEHWNDQTAHSQAVEESFSLVESALINGSWTLEETQALQERADSLREAERHQLREKILDAINNQQLSLDGPLILPF